MGDGDNPLRSVAELGEADDEGDDDGQEDEAGADHVDGEGLGEVVLGEGGPVEARVEEVGHPLGVADTVGGKNRNRGRAGNEGLLGFEGFCAMNRNSKGKMII